MRIRSKKKRCRCRYLDILVYDVASVCIRYFGLLQRCPAFTAAWDNLYDFEKATLNVSSVQHFSNNNDKNPPVYWLDERSGSARSRMHVVGVPCSERRFDRVQGTATLARLGPFAS